VQHPLGGRGQPQIQFLGTGRSQHQKSSKSSIDRITNLSCHCHDIFCSSPRFLAGKSTSIYLFADYNHRKYQKD
jgi:hypothetical protein